MTDQSKRVGGVTPPPSTQHFDEKVLNALKRLGEASALRVGVFICESNDRRTVAALERLTRDGRATIIRPGYFPELTVWEATA